MDTTKLKELAERASVGDWGFSPCVADKHFLGQVWRADGESLCIMDHMTEQANADGAFIAAANPQAILGLLERLEKAEQHWANENSNNMALIAEVEWLRTALQAVHAEVDGNIRPLTRDLVNMVSGVKNGSHPNDIYDHCDEIDRIIDAALEGGGR